MPLAKRPRLGSVVPVPDSGVPAGVQTRVLHAEDFVLVVGADHPLAGQAEVDVAALKDQDFITFTRGSGIDTALRAVCRAAGFEPHAKFESSVLQTVRSLAAGGLGVTMLPRSFAESDEAAVLVPLAPPTPKRRVAVAWGDRALPAATAFVQFVAQPSVSQD